MWCGNAGFVAWGRGESVVAWRRKDDGVIKVAGRLSTFKKIAIMAALNYGKK